MEAMIKLITFGSQGISSIILLSKAMLDRAVPIFMNLHNTASNNTEQNRGWVWAIGLSLKLPLISALLSTRMLTFFQPNKVLQNQCQTDPK